MEENRRKEEIRQAIDAGQEAIRALKQTKESLNSAKSWGIWDMIGGGLLSSAVKHSRLDKAQDQMEDAKRKLNRFRQELKDVSEFEDVQIETGSFLKFMDIFMDNMFADLAVQSKINKARAQVDSAIQRIEMILIRLKQEL